ncbi:MAG TPA: hypothetical protein EYN67_00665 [Flavobacteriales bacterium]|nr:hypothetical protein [Flavobacteriales bacterium]
MVFPLAGIIGGMLATRVGYAAASGFSGVGRTFLRSPIIQGGQFGVGYTSGAYGGYGVSNTFDPLGIHKPKYRATTQTLLPYGSYGRRRYSNYGSRSYGSRYSGYTRYSRYRRRRPMYRRRSYY